MKHDCAVIITIALLGCGGGGDGDPDPVSRDNGDLVVRWPAVTNPDFEIVRDAFRSSGAFEAIANTINSQLALPRDLSLEHRECGTVNAFYSPSDSAIFMCYEMYLYILSILQPIATTTEELVTLLDGTWYFILFHEFGHALYDFYDLPAIGSEEDAVDEMATLVLIEGHLEQYAVAGALFWAAADSGMYSLMQYADVHSLNPQRFFNILCLVYGSDPAANSELAQLFPSRDCQSEFRDKSATWDELLADWRL